MEILTDFYGTARYIPYTMLNNAMIKLFEYHIDVFGLIEKGLAIDMNELSTKNK